MKRNRLFPALGLLLVRAAAEAAIPLNSLQTFDAAPLVADWSTRSAAGVGSSIFFTEDLDIAIQTNRVSEITNMLRAAASDASFGLAQWNSNGQYLVTRPVGIAYQILLGTLRNTSGKSLSSVVVGYELGNPFPAPGSEEPGLNGLRAYYSLTGQPNSWTQISELSTSQTGSVIAVIPVGIWPPETPLYLLWADDNGIGADGPFTIDDFVALESIPPPPPPSIQPPGTNVLQGRTVQLSFEGWGLGLAFQWVKDGFPIDPAVNPTARQRTLMITNVSLLDSGQYGVIVSNPVGSVFAGPVSVAVGHFDPVILMLFAYDVPNDLHRFHLNVNLPLCTDFWACGGDASSPFIWGIHPENRPEDLQFPMVAVNGTNVDFTMESERVAGQRYVIKLLDPTSAREIGGSAFWGTTSITSAPSLYFQQGIKAYGGTQDTEVHSGALADSILGAAQRVNVDLDNGGSAQGLLRFDNLFGNGLGQIPAGACIQSATLSLAQLDAGSVVTMHRMLVSWDQATATWNGFGDGITIDGVEARTNVDGVILSGATDTIDITASLQAWSNGEINHGWLMQSTGADGLAFASSESAQPPALTVILEPRCAESPCLLGTVQLPALLNLVEGQLFYLGPNIGFSGFCPLAFEFQWQKNGTNIQGARSGVFSTSASVCDAGSYRVIVSAIGQSVTSNPVIVSISADVTRPVLARAFAGSDGTNIVLTFSKGMNATNATNVARYVLDPPVPVTRAILSPDGRTVSITTAPRFPLTAYTLRIQDVTDNRAACLGSLGNVISPNPTRVQLTSVRMDVPWNTDWLYCVNNQDTTLSASAPWYAPNFTPGLDWFSGRALLGNEMSAGVLPKFPVPLGTFVASGQITTYFRKQIDLPPLPPGVTYALCHFIDDGAVFYLDGAELARVNMDRVTPTLFGQHAKVAVEASMQCFPFTATPGSHLLAVEVHQAGIFSDPDLLFGAQVEALPATRLDIGGNQPLISWNADSNWELLTSSNVAGPYAPAVAGPSLPLGSFPVSPTNPAAFFRLRYKGTAK